jgi:hypothetical protein
MRLAVRLFELLARLGLERDGLGKFIGIFGGGVGCMCWAKKAKWVEEWAGDLLVGSKELEVEIWFVVWSGAKVLLASLVEYSGIGFWNKERAFNGICMGISIFPAADGRWHV